MAIPATTADLGQFMVQKDITSSTIKTATATNVFEVEGNGVVIEDVYVRTDSTGLAGGTAFQLLADGVVFFSTAISGLGASKVLDLANATVTKIKAPILAGTKYIAVQNTVADGTGAGIISVFIKVRRGDTNSSVRAL